MKNWKMSITNGQTFAPAMIVTAENEEKAVQLARSMSGLGAFEAWVFEAIQLNSRR